MQKTPPRELDPRHGPLLKKTEESRIPLLGNDDIREREFRCVRMNSMRGVVEIVRNSVESWRLSVLLDYAAAASLASGFRETVLASDASSSGISR